MVKVSKIIHSSTKLEERSIENSKYDQYFKITEENRFQKMMLILTVEYYGEKLSIK